MGAQGRDEMEGVEALGKHFVKGQEGLGVVPGEEIVHQGEAVFVVEDVEVADDVFVLHGGAAEGYRLVEDGQRVAHGPVGLHGDDVEGLVVDGHAFLDGDVAEVADDVGDGDAVEVVGLAAAQDRREDLVLLGRRQDEDGVCRRLLEGLEEGVERLSLQKFCG